MEGGGGVGPSTTTTTNRPVRAASRYYYALHSSSSPTSFCGPVRRWEKKWVHVSSSKELNGRQTPNNKPKSPRPGVLLCKWTPLPRPSNDAGGDSSVEPPLRKFRYTPNDPNTNFCQPYVKANNARKSNWSRISLKKTWLVEVLNLGACTPSSHKGSVS